MTVQGLIKYLQKIEDKSLEVVVPNSSNGWMPFSPKDIHIEEGYLTVGWGACFYRSKILNYSDKCKVLAFSYPSWCL